MALTPELEALIIELAKTDPAGAGELRKTLEAHPTLQTKVKESVLRQSDYDRFLNEHKEGIEYGKTMKTWADTAKPEYDRMKAAYSDLERQLEEKTAAAVSAAAGEGSKIDLGELQANVMSKLKAEGIATKSELNAMIAAEADKLVAAKTKEFFDVKFPQSASWLTGMVSTQFKYRDEFGKSMDEEAFAKFLLENQIADPRKGYDQFVSNLRSAAEIEKKAEERVKVLLEERKGTFPGSSGSPAGPIQVRLAKKDANDSLFNSDMQLGDGSAAALAAAELSADGK